ncbi:CU044_2847 family protein [Actinoplanes sp. NPDC051470]|uniref:CU044_2847 family protein n=1 Tax=unclassified Actinoplanes TaxID=2626549 RepID=UPI0034498875
MAHLLEFSVGEGVDAVVTFEVDPDELPDELVLASNADSPVAGRVRITFEEALHQLKPSLQKVATLVRELAPTEASVEFGLKMGGQTGVIVAKGNAEANFKLALVWK